MCLYCVEKRVFSRGMRGSSTVVFMCEGEEEEETMRLRLKDVS